MLRASKLWKSSSTSGPVSTSNPACPKIFSIRKRVRVTGCRLPGSWPRPGKLTSMVPLASSRCIAACSSRIRCISSAAWIAVLASLMRWPAAGRSAAESAPKPLSCSVMSPFLPSSCTRTSSSAPKSVDASIAASAWLTSAERDSAAPTSLCREAGFGFFRDRCKGRHVMHRQIRKHFAVDGKACLVETVDERAVGHAAEPRGCIDARDPQCAVLALLFAPAAIGILAGLDDRLFCRSKYFAAGVEVALRFLENFLVPPTCDDTAFHSCHGLSPDFRRSANIA